MFSWKWPWQTSSDEDPEYPERRPEQIFVVRLYSADERTPFETFRIQGDFEEFFGEDITEINATTIEGKQLIIRASKYTDVVIEEA